MNIINKIEQALQSRTEVVCDITFSGPTPTRKQLKGEIAKKMESKDNLVVIQKIDTEYGFGKATVTAHVYKKEEDMKTFASEYLLKRGTKEQKKEAPKEAAKPPEKPEEKKEDKPAEPKEDKPAAKPEEKVKDGKEEKKTE